MLKLQNFSGGRGFHVDDVQVLQEQLDQQDKKYAGYGAFIFSGCKVTGNNITNGLIYINGKSIYFPGQENVAFPCYIVQGNNLDYQERFYDIESVNKFAFTQLNAIVVTAIPINGEYITITTQGGRSYVDVLNEILQLQLRFMSLTELLTNEANVRNNADTVLNDRINSEAGTRHNEDLQLHLNINNEASTRSNADQQLQININNEASARANGDSQLQSNKADIAQPGFTNINLLNGAYGNGSGDHYYPGFMRSTCNFLHFRGELFVPYNTGDVGTQKIVFKMDEGYRVSARMDFYGQEVSGNANNPMTLLFYPNGEVKFYTNGNPFTGYFDLENIPPIYLG